VFLLLVKLAQASECVNAGLGAKAQSAVPTIYPHTL